jgi:hypothetical protein
MRAQRSTLALVLLATLATAAPAGARPSAGVDVCRLLTAKQVTTVQGVSPKCTNAKPMAGPGSTIYGANWAGKTPRSAALQVTVSLYSDQGALGLAKRNLNQGLPGTPKKVVGIGSGAYEATGGISTAVRFAEGKYIVLVGVSGIGKPSWSLTSVEALAKGVARRLPAR